MSCPSRLVTIPGKSRPSTAQEVHIRPADYARWAGVLDVRVAVHRSIRSAPGLIAPVGLLPPFGQRVWGWRGIVTGAWDGPRSLVQSRCAGPGGTPSGRRPLRCAELGGLQMLHEFWGCRLASLRAELARDEGTGP